MITNCTQGAKPRHGLNYINVCDGGVAVVLWVWRWQVFYRRRGKLNPERPRHILNLNVV